MRYALAAILVVAAVISGGFCKSHSFFSSRLCRFEGPNPIHEGLCGTYVDCVRNADGTFTAQHERCPTEQLFNSETLQCSTATTVSGRARRMVKRQDPGAPTTTPAPTTAPDCHSKMFSCANCTAIRACSKNANGTFTYKRDTSCTGTTPYCNDQKPSCVSTLPMNCDSGFPCLEPGYFPDMTNCNIFHFCYVNDKKELVDAQGYCEPNYVYSAETRVCKPRTSQADCHVAVCPVGANGLYVFTSEPKYYVLCDNGKPQVVAACPENQEFLSNGECGLVCKRAGSMADPQNCKKYYDCTPTTAAGPPYKMTSQTCPGGLAYSQANGCSASNPPC